MSTEVTSLLVRHSKCSRVHVYAPPHPQGLPVATAGAEGEGRRPGATYGADVRALPSSQPLLQEKWRDLLHRTLNFPGSLEGATTGQSALATTYGFFPLTHYI